MRCLMRFILCFHHDATPKKNARRFPRLAGEFNEACQLDKNDYDYMN